MDFNLNKEQELLREGLGKFLATRYDLEKSRTAAKVGPGWQPEIWRGLADELGILGAAFPESVGGIGGGPVEIMVIAEELGRALVIEPFIDTVVVAGGLLQRSDHPAASALLERIAQGGAIVAVASTEPDGEHAVSTRAIRDRSDWVLTGEKIVVTAAPLATHLLITARTSGEKADSQGISLFLTEFDPSAPPKGVRVHGYRTIDDRRAADLSITQLRLPADAQLTDDASPSLARARDEGAAAVCAEAVGAMRKVLADTVEYCKQRQQFGQPIGNFQVLQHRMVDMYMEVEQSVAAVYLAVLNLQAEPDTRARSVSAAKATVGRAARFLGQNAVQLHGGMGMTEELAIGHYFKRLTALQYEFGSTDSHRARYAKLTRP
ncbi:acyl-CoA dehydrogenase family protein [Mycobacterium sp. CVI_P3]|uniref:Acyl-CoA dehydrogenase family protein n=1 Tax=Mycobacterium pinniadriaticum TaxID=2994102 RepID=A0ABT3SAG4_9MYCO|nr:acyl-CoA dehydrogenase family protein [Mycobacterium pinniadriaticum]MCX2929833.1 acyl-CoA dehydrogenase family protein [Mycobacterium pinniadriaticum]MCX2936518.1 acyl-CoA dehydrogenase family protein [Mycobacterium pinniadriaticum]